MTTPSTPLLLHDNVFDIVSLYPGADAALTASAEVVGAEAFRAIDCRRDRSYWTPPSAAADTWLMVQLATGLSLPVDSFVLDRGHNLWSKTVYLEGSADGVTWSTSQAIVIPAQGTVGGSATLASPAVTEEGAVWGIGNALPAYQYWRLRIPSGYIPIITGFLAGSRLQLLGYAKTFDEDRGSRTQVTDISDTGYAGTARTYTWRTLTLSLGLIGATEYDASIRTFVRDRIWGLNQPVYIWMDCASHPERGWLYQWDGTEWSMPKDRVYRAQDLAFRECGARI